MRYLQRNEVEIFVWADPDFKGGKRTRTYWKELEVVAREQPLSDIVAQLFPAKVNSN